MNAAQIPRTATRKPRISQVNPVVFNSSHFCQQRANTAGIDLMVIGSI